MENVDNEKNVLIACSAKGPENAAFHDGYRILTLILEVEQATGVIINSDVTFIANLPRQFVQSLLNGKNINDAHLLKKEIQKRVFIPTKKTLIQALLGCYKTYTMIQSGQQVPDNIMA